MGVLEELFTKRGDALDVDTSESSPSIAVRGDLEPDEIRSKGAFEEVFVRRGRWRKGAANGTVDYAATAPADASFSDLASPSSSSPSRQEHAWCFRTPESTSPVRQDSALQNLTDKANFPVEVKNTFVNAAVLDFDSLQDFLEERQVKSCPASRQHSSITMLMEDIAGMGGVTNSADSANDVFNTASSFGVDGPHNIASERDLPKYLNFSDSAPTFNGTLTCQGLEWNLKEQVLNTASTFMDTDFVPGVPQRSDEVCPQALELSRFVVSDGAGQDSLFHMAPSFQPEAMPAPAMPDDSSVNDRLKHLRMRGSVVQHEIGQTPYHETQWAPGSGIPVQPEFSLEAALAPIQWPTACQMSNSMAPGIESLMGNLQQQQQSNLQQQQTQLFSTPCEETLGMDVSVGSSHERLTPLLPTQDAAAPGAAPAPVLRLAEAIAPPELGSPELPSIGSLLHHKGDCKPCTFFHTRGCENNVNCNFCHLCGPGEKKKRLKAMKAQKRQVTFAALETAKAALANWSIADEQDIIIE